MHAPLLSPLQKRLLDAFQRDLPLVPRPFAAVGAALGATEGEVIAATRDLLARGIVSRVGAVVRPNTAGASTLAALACAPARLDAVAAIVSAEPGVNHNYAREHDVWPLWFVATGPDRAAVDATLDRLRAATGCAVLDLPLVKEYRIDLGFALDGPRRPCPERRATRAPDALERAVAAAAADGLALVERPYATLGAALGLGEDDVLAALSSAHEAGIVKRLGWIVRHRPLGFSANAMCVFDVDEAEIDDLAARFLEVPAVTLLYRRRPAAPHWPFALYAMIHGRERSAVEVEVEGLLARAGRPLPHRILFSTRCYKQTGARLVR